MMRCNLILILILITSCGILKVKELKLDLAEQGLEKIPSVVFQKKQLEVLHLGHNSLNQLPDSLFQLKNLKVLTLPSNNIQKIPPKIGQLINLESLGLSNNPFKSFPPEISNLKRLRLIVLINNKLSDAEIKKLRTYLPNVRLYISSDKVINDYYNSL